MTNLPPIYCSNLYLQQKLRSRTNQYGNSFENLHLIQLGEKKNLTKKEDRNSSYEKFSGRIRNFERLILIILDRFSAPCN